MIYLDLGFVCTLIATWCFNKTIIHDHIKRLEANAKNINTERIEPQVFLFLIATDFLNVSLYILKFLSGCHYIMASSFPAKKDYEYLYKGRIGHHMWRVNRVKSMRKTLVFYFVVSTVSVLYQVLNGLVIDGCFAINGILDFRIARMCLTTLIAIY